jgi:uncharacterized protein (DUF983 family)
MPARSLASAQFYGKCPRCRQGDIFKYPLTNIIRFSAMYDQCPHCGASFQPEPGFYFGAMFVSYALTVGLFVSVGLILYFFVHPSDTGYVVWITIAAMLFTPFSFRYSRVLFLYWFGGYRYDPQR